MADRLADYELPSDPARTLVVARWAYQQGADSGAQLWLRKREFEPADQRWRRILIRS